MRPALRRALPLLAVIAGVLLLPAVALAHPLGNFTVSTSAGIVLSPGAVRIDYVVDMAEIPTVQAMPELDADADGQATASERAAWASATAPGLLANLTLVVDGDPVALEISSAHAELLPGQGGLDVLRLAVAFAGELPDEGELAFRDANFEDRIGWHEVTAAGADGVALARSSVPATSVTGGLRAYPDDLLSSPLDVREATMSFAPGASVQAGSSSENEGAGSGDTGGALAGVVERTGPLMLFALLLAFGFGALHAMGPGHGKTLMAAYLVGSGGRVRQAVAVGGAVAVMHTASVLALGVVVLFAAEVVAPERLYPWLGLASGLVALALGAGLLVSRLAEWGGGPAGDHPHPHPHPHTHPHPTRNARVLTRRGLFGLALAGGILPSPTALVVLLASVALDRVAYGLALIGAFSLGLASSLVAVGILALRARDVVARRMSSRSARLVPVASAGAIVLMGLVLTVSGATSL